MSKKKANLKALLAGVGIGAGLGLLFAPKKGSELRKDLKNKLDELVAKIKEVDLDEVKDEFFNKVDNTHRFYVIPTQFDITKPVRLHLSEGPFDSLGIYLNLMNGRMDNDIYSNIGGSGYKGIIKYFINVMKLPNLEINYYPDAEISQHLLFDIAEVLKPFHFKFNIIRNEIGKDFGVRRDQMKPIIVPVEL